MEVHEFDIEIRPDGKVLVRVQGAKGPACLDYAKFFEQLLNSKAEIELTSEYYEPPSQVEIKLDQGR